MMTARKSTLQNIVSGFGVRSEHRIGILNAKSIGKEHSNVFLTEQFIEKTVSFWDPVKKFPMSHQKCSTKKVILKNSTIFTGKHLCWSLFSAALESLQLYQKETPTQVFPCEYCRYFRNNFYTEHLRAITSKS